MDDGIIRREAELVADWSEREDLDLDELWLCDTTYSLIYNMLMWDAIIGGCKPKFLYYILIKSAFGYRLFYWKLKIKNNKKIIKKLLFTLKVLCICLNALFIFHEQCKRHWFKKKTQI